MSQSDLQGRRVIAQAITISFGQSRAVPFFGEHHASKALRPDGHSSFRDIDSDCW
jgi:hypothetical protein